jgi:hypothetical protein
LSCIQVVLNILELHSKVSLHKLHKLVIKIYCRIDRKGVNEAKQLFMIAKECLERSKRILEENLQQSLSSPTWGQILGTIRGYPIQASVDHIKLRISELDHNIQLCESRLPQLSTKRERFMEMKKIQEYKAIKNYYENWISFLL